jgi:hypothetical protein
MHLLQGQAKLELSDRMGMGSRSKHMTGSHSLLTMI